MSKKGGVVTKPLTVILTHDNTDFDALASLLGAAKIYADALPVLPRRLNRNVRNFLTLCWDELPFYRVEDLPKAPVERAIVVDSQVLPALKGMKDDISAHFIDHHPLARELPPGATFFTQVTGANTTIFAQKIEERDIPISPIEATLLLLGIHEDTGSLTYSSTTPTDARCAAWLMDRGANVEVVREFLHYPLSEAQRRLYNELIEHGHAFDLYGQAVVVATASAPHYVEEISTLAHKLQNLFEPDALFLLVDLGDHLQLIARSTTDEVDVGAIAKQFGGGGHDRAAAALVRDQSLNESYARLLELLHAYVRPATTVRQIMSRGVPHTLTADTTVAEAAEVMQRYGHEGFPVVEDGHIVGILTRREIDKAMHHKLGNAAIKLYMHKGEVAVHPDDAVERLQAVMMEYGIGQVPVVQGDKVVGIVTRTDLINLWGKPTAPSREAEIIQTMEENLPPPLVALLRNSGQMAAQRDAALYIVGGFVRDLLLGSPTFDLDLVVEGDAIALAKALAQTYGGRVRSHSRFGTAKWLIGPGQWQAFGANEVDPQLPSALDFVTARTEFYTQPTALPEVERSSIRQDLHRRDFTVNTLAIRLDDQHFGELLDFYGGEHDLKEGLIRVLHSLSFIEDPTRMLRAVRLEQRLGFQIEERTEELINNALPMIDRVSGERIQHELISILQEDEPEPSLCRLQELNILQKIHPALHCDDWLSAKYRLVRQHAAAPVCAKAVGSDGQDWKTGTYLALLAFRLPPSEVEAVAKRLKIHGAEAATLRQVAELRDRIPGLQKPQRPSSLYRLLAPYSDQALSVLWIAVDEPPARQEIERFCHTLRYVEPAIDGHYLKEQFKLPPGPVYRQVLDAVRDARLDGEISSLEEEKELVERILKKPHVQLGEEETPTWSVKM
jgi:tRNA nucleotidyltransferase (CCA-adding enzyme)